MGQERQSSKVSTCKAMLRIASPLTSGLLLTVKASEPSDSQLSDLPSKQTSYLPPIVAAPTDGSEVASGER